MVVKNKINLFGNEFSQKYKHLKIPMRANLMDVVQFNDPLVRTS